MGSTDRSRAASQKQHEDDEGQAEPKKRRALRHEVGEDRIEPLVVEVAVKRVLARQVHQGAEAAVLNVPDEAYEAQSSTQQKDEDCDRRRSAASGEALSGEIQHCGKREA